MYKLVASWALVFVLGLGATAATAASECRHQAGEFEIDPAFHEMLRADGRETKESDFDSKYRIVAFGFTHCPDVCPLSLDALRRTLLELADVPDQIAAVFVTVDPDRDTPEVLARHLAQFDRRIIGLTGPTSSIERVAKNYGADFRKRQEQAEAGSNYLVGHTSRLVLVEPGRCVVAVFDISAGPSRIARAVAQQVRTVGVPAHR